MFSIRPRNRLAVSAFADQIGSQTGTSLAVWDQKFIDTDAKPD
jgi:hypothetical protein